MKQLPTLLLILGLVGCSGNQFQLSHTLKVHSGPLNCLDFSPDRKRIVSGSADKTVKVWDISPLATSK